MTNSSSKDVQWIVDQIDKYRLINDKPKDDKVRPLQQSEIDRFPKIPDNWAWMLSNDISTFITNGVHSPTSKKDELGINKRMVRITDIDDSGFADFTNLPYCKRFVKGDYDKTLKKNDIYISFTGNVLGKRYLVKEDNEEVVYAHYFVRWQPIVVDPEYIYYVLRSKHFENFMDAYKLGSTQPNLKVTDLKRVPLPIAPLAEQKKISKILGDLDKKILLNRQTNQTLERIAQAIFKNWFVDFEPVRAKIAARDTGQDPELTAMAAIAGKKVDELNSLSGDQLEQLKSIAALFPANLIDSELGEIPEGWEVRSFGDVSSCFDSKRIPLSKKQRQEKKPGHIPYYGATSVMDYVNEWIFDDVYLLLGEDGSVVKEDGTPFVQYIWGKSWVNNHAHVLQGKNGVSTEQLMIFIQSQNIASYVTGAVQLKLNQKNMNSIPFLDAGEVLNKIFQDLISPLYQKLRVTVEQNKTLDNMRDSLLPKLLSGTLEGTNIDG